MFVAQPVLVAPAEGGAPGAVGGAGEELQAVAPGVVEVAPAAQGELDGLVEVVAAELGRQFNGETPPGSSPASRGDELEGHVKPGDEQFSSRPGCGAGLDPQGAVLQAGELGGGLEAEAHEGALAGAELEAIGGEEHQGIDIEAGL